MAREFLQKSYYDHTTFSNVYYAFFIPIEHFLANIAFKSDISRVIYSSDSMVFRRRFELNDNKMNGDLNNINPSNLNLPFCNYFAEKFWEPDDRPYSVQPMQMLRGEWIEGLPSYLRAMAVKNSFYSTLFFDRDDDARLAYEMLLWEMHPKGPTFIYTTIKWRNNDILIPVFITIDSVTFNPTYKESDWLTKQRIYTIRLEFTVRSYILFYPQQINIFNKKRNMTPYKDLFGENTAYDSEISITEEVILNFGVQKQFGINEEYPFFEDEEQEKKYLIENKKEELNPIFIDIIKGYFQSDQKIEITSCEVVPSSITQNSFVLKWSLKDSDKEFFDKVRIAIPGRDLIEIYDVSVTEYLIDKLEPSSTYSITFFVYSIDGSISLLKLSVTTLEDPNNKVKTPLKKRLGRLKGMSW